MSQDRSDALPVCVDLDGTLVRSDTLAESLLVALHSWRVMARLPLALANGRVALKAYLAAHAMPDVAHLPYDDRVIAWLGEQRAAGRHAVLATAADSRIAQRVAAHVALFDEIVEAPEGVNLKGEAKARRLCERFGERGFVYVGNERADLPVWRAAAAAVLVRTPRAVARAARASTNVLLELPGERASVRLALRAMRPHQWLKNLLVFVPLLTAGGLTEWAGWVRALLTFVAFSLVASSIYVVNDLTDLAADRMHPRKRARPFASGHLALSSAPVIVGFLVAAAIPLAIATGTFAVLASYAVCSVAYSLKLKERALIDVFCLAVLYTLRLVAGGVATGHAVSPWLMAFSVFLFLSLGTVKRVTELQAHGPGERASLHRRGYGARDLNFLSTLGIGAGIVSALVLALYLQSDVVASRFATPVRLWPIVGLELYWVCNVWHLAFRGEMHDDPIVFAARDRHTLFIAAVAIVCVLLAR